MIARRLGPFPEIVETSGGGALFETEEELLAAMTALQTDPGARDRQSKAGLKAFEEVWSEGPVLARYGTALAGAARAAGRIELADILDRGAFQTGTTGADVT